jgi:class 3 adenylate cyclase
MRENISFGKWLRQRRRTLDLSQQALANQAACARITLSRIEADTLKPSREMALILLDKVGILPAEREQWVRFARGQSDMPVVSSLPTGTVVFLWSDLVGFIHRFQQDPDSALQMLAQHDQLLHSLMTELDGKVFNVRGDNFTVAFTNPIKAVNAALAAQRIVAKQDWGVLEPVQTQMILHIGQATVHPGGGYLSLSLGYLELIQKFAKSGKILLSQEMAAAVQAHLPVQVRLVDLGEYVISTQRPSAHLFQIDLEG